MDNENRHGAGRERIVCAPNGGQHAREGARQTEDAGGVSKRSEGRAEDQTDGRNSMEDCARDSAAHGKSKQGNGNARGQRLQQRERSHGIVFARAPVHRSTALAVSRIVEDQRGDAVSCEKLLRPEPVIDDFSNAMADEERGLRRRVQRRTEPSCAFPEIGEDLGQDARTAPLFQRVLTISTFWDELKGLRISLAFTDGGFIS